VNEASILLKNQFFVLKETLNVLKLAEKAAVLA
jgi:hypothetical protein